MLPTPSLNAPMLAGLFLARFDLAGLKHLGFSSFTEAFKAESMERPDFFAFEVKGLAAPSAGLRLTEKEFRMAWLPQDRHNLAVVSNFQEQPRLCLHRNPLAGLPFERQEQTVTLVTWNHYHRG